MKRPPACVRRLVGFAGLAGVLFALERTVWASPEPRGLVVAASPACRVALTQLSYDDPDGDDAEFLVLHVERATATTPPPGIPRSGPLSDAGPDAARDAAIDGAAAPPILGDCGLEALELVSGGNGACEVYRSLPLADVRVPEDGYVTFCAAESRQVGSVAPCDVRAAGRSALRNGWLQNGPADGLRFRGGAGEVLVEAGYEGALPCFGKRAVPLVEETGEASGNPSIDDVNVYCDGQFVRIPADTSSKGGLRGPVACPGALEGGADAGSVAAEKSADAGAGREGGLAGAPSGAGGFTAERAPGGGGVPSRAAASSSDAGLVALKRPAAPPPTTPGCSSSRGGASVADDGAVAAWVAGMFTVMVRRRRKRNASGSTASAVAWAAGGVICNVATSGQNAVAKTPLWPRRNCSPPLVSGRKVDEAQGFSRFDREARAPRDEWSWISSHPQKTERSRTPRASPRPGPAISSSSTTIPRI